MSRFPSTALESGGQPIEAVRRSAPVPVPSTALTVSPNAPGLAATPPVSEGAMLAAQLDNALGAVGQTAEAIHASNERKRIEEARAQAKRDADAAEVERRTKEIESQQRGDGALTGNTQLPGVVAKIENRTIKRDRAVTADQQATSIIDELTKGMNPATAEGYRRAAQDNVARALVAIDQEDINRAKLATLQAAQADAVTAKTADELHAAYAAAVATGEDPTKAAGATYLTALQVAAKKGTAGLESYKMAAAAMPPKLFAAEREAAKLVLQNAIDGERADNYRIAADDIGNQLYTIEQGGVGVSFDTAKASIEKYRAKIGGANADTLLQRVQSRKEEYDRDLLRKIDESDKTQLIDDHTKLLDAAGDAGLLFALPPLDAHTRKGTAVKMNREEGYELATQRAFATIAKQEPDPTKRLRRQAAWASKNGVQPGEWERILAAGFTASTDAAVIDLQNGKGELPPATLAGVELYRQLSAVAPQNLSRLVKDAKTREFYDAIEAATSLPEIGSPEAAPTQEASMQRLGQAINTARRATFDDGVTRITNREIDEKVDALKTRGFWRADAGNSGEIMNAVARQARIYAAMGVGTQAAVDRAAKNFENSRIDINGWWVDTAGTQLTDQMKSSLPGVADEIIKRYVAAHPNSGYKPGDLTIRNDQRTGLWSLVSKETGITPESPKGIEWVYFSNRDLTAVHDQMRKVEDKSIISQQLAMIAKYEPDTGSPLGFTRQSGRLVGLIHSLEDKLVMNDNRPEVDRIIKKLNVLIPLRDEIRTADDAIARSTNEVEIKRLKAHRQSLFDAARNALPADED